MNAPHASSPPLTPEALIARLEEQRLLLDDLGVMAERQAELIRGARTDALLRLLEERQAIIDRFAEGQESLQSVTEPKPDGLPSASEEQRTRIRALVDEIERRLAAVIAGDEADQRVLDDARRATGREVAALDTAQQARRAYGQPGPPATDTRFADRRG